MNTFWLEIYKISIFSPIVCDREISISSALNMY